MVASFFIFVHIPVDKLTFAIIPATPPQSIRRVRSVALFAAVLFSFPIALNDSYMVDKYDTCVQLYLPYIQHTVHQVLSGQT